MKPSSYDILGSREKSIAIIEEVENPKQVAEQIMKEHKNIKSVLMKLTERKGIERKRKYKLILGDLNTEVIHKENYCRFKLDPQKVYFSGREGTERLKIAEIVKPKETVLVMFSGIGPFSILIAKKQKDIEKIPSIEINPDAVEYMKENIRLNKVQDKVIPILGDVEEKSQEWFGKCDRVIMPLPHEARGYLELAYKCLKPKGGIIHLYIIEPEKEVKEKVKELIKEFKERAKRKLTYKTRRVLPYSPRTYKYCVDIQVGKINLS
ncbi:MAG: class I SAM-dependent methyltransferase family protein [Candidatus Aenigmarchaeota archaeon]|nr:class I SAM-dependent methyltransferase family protein [Candidatus Aenigmarchaeota archaeon]